MAIERWLRVTMGLLAVAAAAYLLYRMRFALITVALAAMLAYALLPPVEWTLRLRVAGRGASRFGAVVCVFVLLAAAVAGAVHLAARPVAGEFQGFTQNMGEFQDQMGMFLAHARASLTHGLPPAARAQLDQAINQAGILLVNGLGRILQAAARWLTHVVELVLIPILAFYFLVDLPRLKQEFVAFLPVGWRRPTLLAAGRADRILAGYVRGQLLLMAISGVVVWVGLAVIGVRFPLLLGLVAGLTRAIPVVGPVIGAIPIVGVVFLQSPDAALAVLVFFVVLQLVESKVILPQIIGHELNLQAATILLALLIGNALFGLMGMFLAPPAAAFIKSLRELSTQGLAEPAAEEREAAPPVVAGRARPG